MMNRNVSSCKSITFLYPSRRIGGAQMLFIRLAQEFSTYDDVSVHVVDYPDGYLRSQLVQNSKIHFLPFNDGSVVINFQTTVITPLSNFSDIRYLIKSDFALLNLLFWAIQPYNLQYALYYNGRKLFGHQREINSFVKDLCMSGNVVYMDEANYLGVTAILGDDLNSKYIPIPLDIPLNSVENKKISNGKINIGWLGRISFDKINSIVRIIDEIKLSVESKNIIFHIIGDGEKLPDLLVYLQQSKIDFILTGVLVGNDLDNYMLQNIDLAVSMGTSCMEFAIRKIPIFIIDYSFDPFPEKIKYNWLFETKNYTLGSDIVSAGIRNHSFSQLLSQFKHDHTLGEKCYQYVKENHDIKPVTRLLYEHIVRLSPLDWKKFKLINSYLNPFWFKILYGLFRITVEKRRRILLSKASVPNYSILN